MEVHEFQPLRHDRSVSVRIAEQILARIETGEFPVGTKLPAETELARQFGVSRPSVREALGALQFVGYIDSVRGSGSRVVRTKRVVAPEKAHSDVSSQSILRLFQARLLIEPQVAALAAQDPLQDKLEEAEALIEGMAVVVNESTLHGETDLRVHRALAEVCRNEFMTAASIELLDVAASPSLRATRTEAWKDRELPSIWGGQHRIILEAIRAGDAGAAAEAAWDHLASSAHNALRVVSRDPSIGQDRVDRFKTFLAEGPTTHGLVSHLVANPSHIPDISGELAHARDN